MLIITLSFLTGRFHATPWGRHVNEGVPEWPPAPHRLLRALYDVWQRKRPQWTQTRVEPVLKALAECPPLFVLPPATSSHTRAFLSSNTRSVTDKQKIFDAFVVLAPHSPVLMGWPDTKLDADQMNDLSELLSLLNYLGRSESWIEAAVLPETHPITWNCIPATHESEEDTGNLVGLACPVSAEKYTLQPYRPVPTKRHPNPAPLSWMETLVWSTQDQIRTRCSGPPGMQKIIYQRPPLSFQDPFATSRRPSTTKIEAVLYGLTASQLPSVASTLELAERVRRKIMGIHKKLTGDPSQISPKFSGKNTEGQPLQGHRHVFILPLDRNRDGRVDHILVVCREPFDEVEQRALDRLTSLWQTKGKADIQCVPLQWGSRDQVCQPVVRVVSVTPFVPTRHYRKGRGPFDEWLKDEVRREARFHGLPTPLTILPIPHLKTYRGEIPWWEFRRNRKTDTCQRGYGFEMTFPNPVLVPIALGYGCHFGLGQFAPRESPREMAG